MNPARLLATPRHGRWLRLAPWLLLAAVTLVVLVVWGNHRAQTILENEVLAEARLIDLLAAGLAIDPDLAEQRWCAYAWPLEPGRTGVLCFFIDQDGRLLSTPGEASGHDGLRRRPQPDAARLESSDGSLRAPGAINLRARDGQVWRRRG